ncbi:hypothetical protein A2524_03580 [Candidatus Wolfebacteria bacterium RIFOXYD12_FULL_48_21]|uniref:Transcriptional repressor PaaX-like central Cas2-like domain-containing protein n=1 Tax=Candidatus Wolfebacteria bacterium RIFOXYD1_FULL_48_65 TaxID=1802561 RepID=A0A1F8DYK8_9BACT|nr:MAG: hypothetical protein A2610_00120 [Candidatus Wolfebacteria bacterium RIFOXYD1_FULL_48_65]OGM95137.1 MAG: hypothetical protein A2524_03580 [Candidatus Wolfebacteria bacterium RIFOXYD12_FULL_48_21]OGM96460.1 MAG: hypothetical protein A2532_00870 [Candidatus Wolfebacteria bacterium RIFOXYD2_FULL_48_11]
MKDRQNMRYKSSLRILEAISEGIDAQLDLLEAVVEGGRGASPIDINYNLNKIRTGRDVRKRTEEEERKMTNRYYSLIYKLKRDGLINEEIGVEKKKYKITERGKQKLEFLKSKEGYPDVYYPKEKGNKVIIVMFDIPEEYTKKRTWLRMVLGNLDFKMAQKSVWIGKTKIPKELIADIMKMKLEGFVEIFEVGSTGNLKHVI